MILRLGERARERLHVGEGEINERKEMKSSWQFYNCDKKRSSIVTFHTIRTD